MGPGRYPPDGVDREVKREGGNLSIGFLIIAHGPRLPVGLIEASNGSRYPRP